MANLKRMDQLALSCGMEGLSQYFETGDLRLNDLSFHPSKAALELWHFLMTEESRLHAAREQGCTIIGAMKDLGTIPMIAFAFEKTIAFYPDGAWWLPCFKLLSTDLFTIADRFGMNEAYCPVRAMLGAFESKNHFPIPDLLVSSTGAICDDFKAISQRLQEMGHAIYFWDMPHVREAEVGEPFTVLKDGRHIPRFLIDYVVKQIQGVIVQMERVTGCQLEKKALSFSLEKANEIRSLLTKIRVMVYKNKALKMGSLEMLIIEMLAIHYCSDREKCHTVLTHLLLEIEQSKGELCDKIPVFWINPVADLKMMNTLESLGGRLCGTDFMFTHALFQLDIHNDPIYELALTALSDPMVCPTQMRVNNILKEIEFFGAKAVVLSRIPGASHSAWESNTIKEALNRVNIPMIEIEVNSVTDSFEQSIMTRLSALLESVK